MATLLATEDVIIPYRTVCELFSVSVSTVLDYVDTSRRLKLSVLSRLLKDRLAVLNTVRLPSYEDESSLAPSSSINLLIARSRSFSQADVAAAVQNSSSLSSNPLVRGRCGPSRTFLDGDHIQGDGTLSRNQLCLRAFTGFVSARSSTCVFAGRWMYEATLMTDGIMQLGWCSFIAPFGETDGVGDFADSYAYDGKRMKKWNVRHESYGEMWVAGDIIGCCADLDAGTIEYFRNGRPMGTAYTGIRCGDASHAYFPACSVSRGESCCLNFGQQPFRYPIAGYTAIDSVPVRFAAQCEYMAQTLQMCVRHYESCEHKRMTDDDDSTTYRLYDGPDLHEHLCGATSAQLLQLVIRSMTPFITDDYFMYVHWLPFLHQYLGTPILNDVFAILRDCVAKDSLQVVLEKTFAECALLVASTVPLPPPLPIPSQLTPQSSFNAMLSELIMLARLLVSFPPFFVVLTQAESFAASLELLFSVKRYNDDDLALMFPGPFSENVGADGIAHAEHALAVLSLTDEVEAASRERQQLVAWFCISTDEVAHDVCDAFISPIGRSVESLCHDCRQCRSPAVFFSHWLLSHVLVRNRGYMKEVRPPHLSSPHVLQTIFSSILPVLQDLERTEGLVSEDFVSTYPSGVCFLGTIARQLDLSVVGGGLAHVLRELPEAAAEMQAFSTGSAVTKINGTLLHACVVLYAFCVGKVLEDASHRFAEVSSLLKQSQALSNADPADATRAAIDRQLKHALRRVTVDRRTLFSKSSLDSLFALSVLLRNHVQSWSRLSHGFLCVPSFYISVLCELFQTQRKLLSQFVTPIVQRDNDVQKILHTLSALMADPRIVIEDVRDSMLQLISISLKYSHFSSLLALSDSLVPSLATCFLGKAWVSAVSVLVRFWKDSFFASFVTDDGSIGCPALAHQFFTCAQTRPGLVNDFINRLFNQLNWTLTEFSSSVDELVELIAGGLPSTRDSSSVGRESRKISVMFELAWLLLRMLEACVIEIPEFFLSADSEVNLARTAEILLYVLNHFSIGSNSKNFDKILTECTLSEVANVKRSAILAPIIGIMARLHAHKAGLDFTRALIDAGIGGCLASLLFLGKLRWNTYELSNPSVSIAAATAPGGTTAPASGSSSLQLILDNFKGVADECIVLVTAERMKQAFVPESSLDPDSNLEDRAEHDLIQTVTAGSKGLSSEVIDDDENICTICYGSQLEISFVPCEHTSCKRCFQRRKLTSNKCFYCNAVVEDVKPLAPPSS